MQIRLTTNKKYRTDYLAIHFRYSNGNSGIRCRLKGGALLGNEGFATVEDAVANICERYTTNLRKHWIDALRSFVQFMNEDLKASPSTPIWLKPDANYPNMKLWFQLDEGGSILAYVEMGRYNSARSLAAKTKVEALQKLAVNKALGHYKDNLEGLIEIMSGIGRNEDGTKET